MTPDPSAPTPDLERLFAQARAGDEAAWEILFRACYPRVIRVVRRKLTRPMRSLFDSSDFASDAFYRLLADLDHLHFPSLASLTAYLERSAEQRVIDETRLLLRGFPR